MGHSQQCHAHLWRFCNQRPRQHLLPAALTIELKNLNLMKKTLTTLLTALLLTFCMSTNTHAADGTALWTNVFNGAGNSNDWANALAVDNSGNVYVTGDSYGSGGNSDYATIKYSGAGVPLWTNRFNGAGNSSDSACALAVDGSGNVYVTGYSTGSGSGCDYATIKYSGAGVPVWTNWFNGVANGGDFATALAVDGNGNVYVTGYSTGSGSGYDYATIKYSSAGVAVWTNWFNGAGNSYDYANALAVDGSGNVYVTGDSYGSGGNSDYATIKYSGAGMPMWTNRFNGAGNDNDRANSLAVDSSGNVYVTGTAVGSGGYFDYATIKYSTAGVPVWTNWFNGAGNGNVATSLAVDGSGNVYVTGTAQGSASAPNYATIKYSSAGAPVWTNWFDGAAYYDDWATSLAVDGSGNVYVTGYSFGFGGNYDYATVKYSGVGVPVWTNRFNGAGNYDDYPTSLAVDGSGNVYVTGYSTGSGSSRDYVTIKYSGPTPPALGISPYGGNQTALFYPASGTNFVLQTTTNLADGPWVTVSNAAPLYGAFVTNAPGNAFFRLH
jgi:hypothetical protein